MKRVHFRLINLRTKVIPWCEKTCSGRYVSHWPWNEVTFEDDDDAALAVLTFDARRIKSKIEQMIEHEDTNKCE